MTDRGYADVVLQAILGSAKTALTPSSLDGLRPAIESAPRAWPDVKVAAERFGQYLAPLIAEAGDSSASLQLGDLFLACACLDGSPKALSHFQRDLLAKVPHVLRSYPSAIVEDVMALLPEKLLVGERAKLRQYRGRARLTRWLKTVAHYAARDINRQRRLTDRDHADGDRADDGQRELLQALAVDAEREYARHISKAEFCQAVSEAISHLPLRQRTLLHGLHVERLTLRELGRPTGADPAAMFRALQQIYGDLRREVRTILGAKLKLSITECDSLIRTMFSQADLRLSQLLKL